MSARLGDRHAADEMRGRGAVDHLEPQRPLLAVHLPRQPIGEVLDHRDMRGRRRAAAVAAPQHVVLPVQFDRGVGCLHAQQHGLPLGPVPGVEVPEHVGRVLDQLLEPALDRMLLRTMLMVGHEQRHHVAAHAVVDRLDARLRVGPHARGDRHRAGRDVDLLGVALPVPVWAGDREELLGVRAGALAKLIRQARQRPRVLEPVQQLGRAVGVRGDDHLLGGVRVIGAGAPRAAASRGGGPAPRTRRRRAA